MPRKLASNAMALLVGILLLQTPARPVFAEEKPEAYSPSGWGLSVFLPEHGTLLEAGNPAWTRSDLEWQWMSGSSTRFAGQVYQIDGTTLGYSSANSDGISMDGIELDSWFEELAETLQATPSLRLLDANANFVTSDARRWLIFNIEEAVAGDPNEETGGEQSIYYHTLFTLDGASLRFLTFFYVPAGELNWLTERELIGVLDPDFVFDSHYGYDDYDDYDDWWFY